MDLKAVVFDMDGVVVDSTRAWWVTFNQALENFGFSKVSEEEFMTEILGESSQDDIEKYFKGVSLSDLHAAYDKFFRINVGDVKAFSDTVPLLDELHSLGLKTAIATNSPRDLALLTLENTGILSKFDVILAGDDVEKGKPNPEMIYAACKKLDVNVGEILYVGDTVADVKAAKAAGCRMVGIGVSGDETITRLRELMSFIK